MSHILKTEPLQNPQFIKPLRLHYLQNGITKEWEAITSHDSVSILLYHREQNAFIVVKQLRPAVLNMNENGMMYELCAGIVDKNKPLHVIAKEEALEECGYNIPEKNILYVTSFFTSVGISGAKQTFFYAEVDSAMQTSSGGGIEDENIEVVYIPIDTARSFMFDENYQKTPGLIMGFYWFFENIMKNQ